MLWGQKKALVTAWCRMQLALLPLSVFGSVLDFGFLKRNIPAYRAKELKSKVSERQTWLEEMFTEQRAGIQSLLRSWNSSLHFSGC